MRQAMREDESECDQSLLHALQAAINRKQPDPDKLMGTLLALLSVSIALREDWVDRMHDASELVVELTEYAARKRDDN
jgi:hypothetical protein